MSFELLPASVQDAPDLAMLINSAYRGDSSRQGWTTEADLLDGSRTDAAAIEEIIRQPDHWIMKYLEAGQLLGCVELHKSGEKLYLGMLTVRPHLQGKGIGKNMLQGAEAEASKLKCRSIYMTVISIRKELIDWYIRHGYIATGEKKPFAFNDERFGQPKLKLEFIVLEKTLKQTANKSSQFSSP